MKKLFVLSLLLFMACIINAQKVNVNYLGAASGWYSDDTRSSTGADLVGTTLTHYGKPGQTPSTAHDILIAQQISLGAGPGGVGALKMDKTSVSGGYSKCTVSKVNLSGFATGDSWLNSFFCNYRYYTNSSAEVTIPKIGIQSTAWVASQTGFTAQRSGESVWDLILVDWRGTDPGWLVGSWGVFTTDKNTVCWRIYRQAGNSYHPAPPTVSMSLQQIKDDPTWGPLIFGTGAKVTSFQLGVGSSAQTSTSYIDYVETNLLNNGYKVDFYEPNELYLSSSPFVINNTIYPNDSWPKPWDPGSDPGDNYPGDLGIDWGFKSSQSFYIVPQVGANFSACDIVVEWDNTMYTYLGVENTGIFSPYLLGFYTHQLGSTTRLTINASILPGPSTPNYFTINPGDYIAKLNFKSEKVGYGVVSFFDISFRIYDGVGGFSNVNFIPKDVKIKNYLGDVVSTTPLSEATGDGKVNIDDLNAWTLSYWSGVPGYAPKLLYYKAKYDIGPTTTTTVYGMPVTDYKIQFEDLVIFAMSYGLSGNGVYPKIAPVPETPVEISVGKPIASANQTLVPIFISGAVQDLRAASLTLSGSFGKFISAENGELLSSYTTPVMLFSRTDNNNIYVDLSLAGADVSGISQEGQLIVLRFEGKANINITTAELRNLSNSPVLVKLNGSSKGIPTEFGISQNYPNPFNPSTLISYQVPVQSAVEISVFNSIGEKITTLVNEVKEPGYYEVTWNAASMTSGVYFFRINAGEFMAVKKMLLMK